MKFIRSKGPILSQVIEILNSLHIYQVSLIDREKHAFLSLPTQKKKNRTIIELMKKLRKTEETKAFYMWERYKRVWTLILINVSCKSINNIWCLLCHTPIFLATFLNVAVPIYSNSPDLNGRLLLWEGSSRASVSSWNLPFWDDPGLNVRF